MAAGMGSDSELQRHWRNSMSAAVANKTLWQALLEMVGRMRKIEWWWMKAHSGILLNECADMLATKGVKNEEQPALVQYLTPVGEDTNARVYEIKEGEATPMDRSRGEEKPERTYVMKDGDNLADYLASAPPSGGDSVGISTVVSAVVSDVVSDDISELEESNKPPMPIDDSAQPEVPRAKPEWWTAAWH
jgi:hypothetical protein